jgi:heme/copper-type cytochrome/quinol oxidase subunit 2
MNMFRGMRKLAVIALITTMSLAPRLVLACSACYGAPGAAQTRGMNFGIFTMLGVTGVVLGGFGGLFFRFARRARRHDEELTP